MKKDVSTEEVKHIAKLSRLEFSDDEIGSVRGHLKKVLGYFETLDGVDVSDVPPTAHILSAVNVLREDVARPSMDNAELLKNAPEADDGAYIVPRVVE
ncbi:MAG: Asp-tRNA(Asn)/Glu-tRNA(Gln) amidotransferase subunit GatC [Clostridiales bacterium]|nr:Asp-tRNA(Asn)/Glu-tRNA(Gln) amidotransferase subunit GatC [Clostridiales bacterium]